VSIGARATTDTSWLLQGTFGGSMGLLFGDTTQTVDAKYWDFRTGANLVQFRTLNDAVNAGSVVWQVIRSGNTVTEFDLATPLKFTTDNAYDIGASGATRPRSIYLGSNASVAGTLGVGAAAQPTVGAFIAPPSTTGQGIAIRTLASQTAESLLIQNSATNSIFQFSSFAAMVNGIQFNPSTAGNPPTIAAIGTDANVGLTLLSKAGGGINLTAGLAANMFFTAGAYQFTGNPVFIRDQNNATTLQLSLVTSAVNAIQISPSATGGALAIGAVGADASINVNIQPKGTGAFQVVIPGATGNSLTVTGPAVPADGVTVTAAATANPATVSLSATGSDANVNLNLISKGTGIVQINGAAIASVIPHIVTFTANGTYTPTAGTKVSDVFIIGGGGGGGTGNVNLSGGGGGAGGYVRKVIQNPLSIAASFAVVIGAGGVGQAVGAASTFIGGTISLSGGGGTNGTDPNSGPARGGGGGTASGGDLNFAGNGGGAGGTGAGGLGGTSALGAGGPAAVAGTITATAGLSASANSGAGGGGGATLSGTNASPGNGGSGICVIIEYF
jgi:hypothetical protein